MSYVGAKPYLIKDGGTGQTALPSNGQLLIGNANTFDVRNLTAGSGINITNGPGSITIASTATPPILTPVFIARKTATSSNVTGDGTDYTVIFDTTDANVGLCYDSTTGIFTAPDTDDYIFMFCVTTGDIGAAHTLADMKIVLGSGVTAHGFYGNPYVTAVSGKMQMSQCVGVMVTASDTVRVSFTVSNGTKIVDVIGSANYDTWFAGYRLSGSGGGGGSQVDGVVDGSGNTVSPTGGLITLVNGNNVSSLSGSASHITLNLTGTTNHAVQIGNATGSLTSLSAGVPGTTLVSAGAGSDPAFGIAQVIGGGTGLSTLTDHAVVLGQGTANVAFASPGTAGYALCSNGAAADPSFQVVPASGGGTGAASLTGVVIGNGASPFTASTITEHYALVAGASNTITSVNPSTAGFVLTSNGPGVDPSFQAVGGASIIATVTDGSGNVVSPTAGNITLVNGNNVSSLSGSPSNITLNLTGTTNHAVQVGNASGALTSIPSGSSGQALISAGAGSDPAFGVLGVPGGGTGSATLTNHAVLLGQGTSAIGTVGLAAAGLPLVSNGLASDPAYGVLTVPGGGTGATSLTNNAVIIGQGTSALSSVGPGALGLPLVGQGAAAPIFASLGVSGGGTGATTLTGILTGNGTSPVTASAVTQYTTLVAGASNSVVGVGPSTAGYVLTSNGAGANPSYQSLGSIGATLTLSDDVNTSITPTAGNIQLVGHVVEQGATKFSTVVAGASIANINPMSPARWIVDGLGFNGTHTTIASAIASASSGDTILILPGAYTENITLSPGINLVALGGLSATNSVSIIGKISSSGIGSNLISGINLQTNGDYAISVTGSSATVLDLQNCVIIASNNTAIQYSSSSSSSGINLINCYLQVQTTGITAYDHSSAGLLLFLYSEIRNSGLSTTTSNTSSTGATNIKYCTCNIPTTFSSSSIGNFNNSQMDTSAVNVVAITLSGTSNVNISNTRLGSGSASILSIGSGCTAVVTNNRVSSTNINVFTGAGTIRKGSNVCTNSSGNSVSTTVNLTVI